MRRTLFLLAAANYSHQKTESDLLKMKEVLECHVSGSDNLCLAAGLVLDDLGVEAANEPGQVAA